MSFQNYQQATVLHITRCRHRNPELWGADAESFNPWRDFSQEELLTQAGTLYHNMNLIYIYVQTIYIICLDILRPQIKHLQDCNKEKQISVPYNFSTHSLTTHIHQRYTSEYAIKAFALDESAKKVKRLTNNLHGTICFF